MADFNPTPLSTNMLLIYLRTKKMHHLFILHFWINLFISVKCLWNLASVFNGAFTTIMFIDLSMLCTKVSIPDQMWYLLFRTLWSYTLYMAAKIMSLYSIIKRMAADQVKKKHLWRPKIKNATIFRSRKGTSYRYVSGWSLTQCCWNAF